MAEQEWVAFDSPQELLDFVCPRTNRRQLQLFLCAWLRRQACPPIDPSRLAVLADALEEAGYGEALLNHLRLPGVHVRGCWAVDRLLGRG